MFYVKGQEKSTRRFLCYTKQKLMLLAIVAREGYCFPKSQYSLLLEDEGRYSTLRQEAAQ
jgi:hypothetical protein